VADALRTQDYLVLNNALEGSNYMSSWTSRRYFTQLAAPHFEVLEIQPGDTRSPVQATAVLKRRTERKA
jgi:hypothetical protein